MTRRKRTGENPTARRDRAAHVRAALYLIAQPPDGTTCCRCDEPITDPEAVNVPGLDARGWAHRSCLPSSLLP